MANLFVIAGHGAGDPGACANGFTEAERVRALASRIKAFGGANVIVGDTNRNWYADNGIGRGDIPKDAMVLELHLDSAAASARGGHVIINSAFSADKYDNALAAAVTRRFPGRSKTIVGRSDLANPNRAASMGYNYRLLECCFISNASDISKFNAEMDAFAKDILAAFDISAGSAPSQPSKPQQPSKPSGDKSIDEVAREVINGAWGNGQDRMNRLTAAGYDANAVQNRVNQILGVGSAPAPQKSIDQVAREVINGAWGNGQDRFNRLRAAGYDPNAVQNRVNAILGGGGSAPQKSLDQVAREVIRGDWGNGQDRFNRLRAAGYDPNAVQNRVNQLM